MRTIRLADIRAELKGKSYTYKRTSGGHEIWKNCRGETISIPCHKREINPALGRRLLKEIEKR